MSKRKNSWSENKIARYSKEGRGQGELADYIPWLKIQDVPSNGNVSRLKGWKTNRQHELLSNLERDYFLLMEWENSVSDIREQFPLNRELTISIAEEKGIKHSIDNGTGTMIVMTTDFFITVKTNNQKKYLARTVKPSEFLEDKRVIEKFEIEREYWERKGIDWGIVTDKDLPREFAKNILWLHKNFYLDSEEEIKYSTLFYSFLLNKKEYNQCILDLCNDFDGIYNLETGSSLSYFKHFIARKYISVDMQIKINPNKLKMGDITLNISKGDNLDYFISW